MKKATIWRKLRRRLPAIGIFLLAAGVGALLEAEHDRRAEPGDGGDDGGDRQRAIARQDPDPLDRRLTRRRRRDRPRPPRRP